MIVLKSPRELALMRQAGRIVAQVHERFREVVRPGITTAELEKVTSRIIEQEGAIPSFKGIEASQPPSVPRSTRRLCTASPAPGGCWRKATSSDSTWALSTKAIKETRPSPCRWARWMRRFGVS